MSRPCAQCRQPLGELELSLKCANPRCTSLCHSSCASGPLLLNDGGRVPRWRCSECQLVPPAQGSGYESVYGRPRAGDTLNRIKDDWGKNRTIDALNLRDRDRGHFDRGSNYRASTGGLLGRYPRPTDLNFTLPVRPKSAILTPTPTEDDVELQIDTTEYKKDTTELKKGTMEPNKEPAPITTTNHPHNNPVPVRLVTPDEKYDETVKSFYKWLEEHECASKDKGVNRGGLVRDKIAQFGSKLEDHLASRNADNGKDIGRSKVQYPVPKSSARWGVDSQGTLPKNQTTNRFVTDQNVTKPHDLKGESYYSGKMIEAERSDQQYGSVSINQPEQPNLSKQMRSKMVYPAVKQNFKPQDSDSDAVYANQQELDNIYGRIRDKSPMKSTHPEALKNAPYGSSIKSPVQSSIPINYATHPYQKEPAMAGVSDVKTAFGAKRGSMTVNHPEQQTVAKEMPIRSNLEYPSPKSSVKKRDDFGVLNENPDKMRNTVKGQEKSFGAIGKSTVGGNVDEYNKGGSIDDGRIYHNVSPIVQRGTQVTEISSLKPLFGTPKSSLTRKVEASDDEVSQEEDDFPPPPPCLETDLDQLEIQPGVEVNSAESAAVPTGDEMVGYKSFNVPAVGNSASGDDRRGLSVGQEIHEDARIVQRASVPTRGTFTLSIVNTNHEGQGVLVREVDDGQPCLVCEKCQGFEAHHWRKTCNSCKCPRESHDVFHEEWVNVRERLGIGQDQDKWGSRDRVISQGLAWAPPGLPPYKVDQYFKCLPQDKVPKLGTSGEKYREKQLMIQLPKQDLALAYCRHVDPANHTSYDDFITARNEIALDIAYAKECSARTDCPECGRSVNPGEVGVLAPKFGDKILWHPACFICSHCKQLLVDLTYCVHDDYLYCERHYAEQLKPRCSACDELIFSGEYTKAMSKDWHSGHFCCWQCDESLTGQRYVLRDDHPYCIKCYESVFANTCDECNKTIGIDSKDLSYKDKHWHEACFFCNKCRVSLVDKQFGSKADKIYCGNCYDAQFASRCDGCGQIFRAGTKKMEYKTRQWHEQCFCCCVCKSAIGTKSFIPREQEIYCATCYEEKFATRCVKCNKIITSGGVTYKNEPWHRECFTCTNCNTSLAGQRFTSRDEKPYCADCFGELFAKRCTSCCKPITGIGGTRFISFEDRHWHNDCFICASCKTSLVGRGFITDAEDILCTECAKQKLM